MPTLTIGAPPRSDFEATPTDAEIEFFNENGYLVVERLTTEDELAWLTVLYEHVFSPENEGQPGAPVDRTNGEGPKEPALLTQAFFPEVQYPELLNTTYHRNARRYAAALLGVQPTDVTSWGHMIRKLPGGREAPWHQDEAYWEPELDYHALGCWLPLHAVTEEMGAMQFIPGSHIGEVRQHVHRTATPSSTS
jgi:ectoine hydroxylase-related dioxygenase (phytanoyl-CoA dioxygenase family)